jgi:peptide/nickel transport system substrate-binding protein
VAELPRGTVTFVFTDIEGSTALLKRLRDRYADVLEQHQLLLRAAFGTHGGREIDTQGDSFFFAFARARDALGAVVDAQQALADHAWPEGGEIRVRMGLHTGEPAIGEQRYIGVGVHRAARISAAGHGGQVLLSNATRELVEDDLPDKVGIRELGTYQLKDVDRPERLFQLEIEGLRSWFPPLKAPKVAEPHPKRRRALVLGALAGVIAAAVSIPIFAFGQGGSEEGSLDAAAGNSVGFVDPGSSRLVADVDVGTRPTDVAVGEGAVWVTNAADGTVDRIDPNTRTVRQTVRVGNGPDGIAVGAGSIWVANGLDGTVSRIDPRSSDVTQTISVGNGPSGIAVGVGKVWVVNRDDQTLLRIEPATGKIDRTIVLGVEPVDVAVGTGGVWVTSQADGKVVRVDPGTGSVLESVSVGRGPRAIAATGGAVWVANSVDGTVSRINPETSAVTATIPVGDDVRGIAAGPRGVWVASEAEASISRIDPATNRISKTVSIGNSPAGVATSAAGVFVAVRPAAGAHRGGTLTVFGDFYDPGGSFDPARCFCPLLSVTNDGLTAFKRVGGRESTEIVPDLAISLPEPTGAGKTYTFRLRKGVRYSTGKPVRPADFRRALERVFELRSDLGDYTYLYSSIVGAGSCGRHRKGCDLSRGIVADSRSGTVTFHLREPDPELPAKLALPFAVAIPQDTPSKQIGRRALPATGPYQIVSYVPKHQIRLVRNPRFREWSRAARPAGYADEIVIRLGVTVSAQVKAVGRGDADVTDISGSGEPDLAALRARYGSRLHSIPGPYVVYTFLNTRLPPFDDTRVRRALNYALDRRAVVRTAGGPEVASPTCQVLPANFPAYRPYCPYLRDLAKAKRLVVASGTQGTSVTVWTRASYRPFYSFVVSALRTIGYHARLKLVDDAAYYDALRKAGNDEVQAGYVGWVTDYPSAGAFITGLLGSLAEPTGFSNKTIERQIETARHLQQTDPSAANELWGRIERAIVDQAPIVPMYNARSVVLVSGRIGNYQYHPLWYTLLDQLWVR